MDFDTFECQVCGSNCGARFGCLGGCGALFYCSMAHARKGRHDEASCRRMKDQVSRGISFNDGFPLWPSVAAAETDNFQLPQQQSLNLQAQRYIPPPLGSTKPRTWLEFYQQYNLSLDDPAALTLHPNLTLTSLIHQLSLDDQSALHILFLGPRVELCRLDLFASIANFCSSFEQINIHFVGDSVPHEWTASSITAESCAPEIRLFFYSGCFHELWRNDVLPKIDASGSNKTILAFLPNAGLAAYPQWIPTMRLLISLAVPFLVSDYNEEALELSLRVLVEQCGVDKTRISEIKLNPFREPVKRNHGGVALPSCSNGFYVICE